MGKNAKYLNFVTKLLSFVNLWDVKKETKCRQFIKFPILVIFTATLPVLMDLVMQFLEDELKLTSINENLVALSALLGTIYLIVCLIDKKEEIKQLVEELQTFEVYNETTTLMEEANSSANFYTKLFLIYGICGNLCYVLMPLLSFKQCVENRSPYTIKYGIPCGLVTIRFVLPFKYDSSPLMEIIIIHQIVICLLATAITVNITMLLCGLLIHIRMQLKQLSTYILDLANHPAEEIKKKTCFCVNLHTKIISFTQNINKAFGTMMILHLTLTSFIISLLGLEILLVNDVMESVRFAMHLAGWLFMLFLVCYYGQVLMDESLEVARAAYSTPWYKIKVKVSVRKDICLILLRAQRPLELRASSLGVMSLATFLGVIKSAYSYFTLLLKLKT